MRKVVLSAVEDFLKTKRLLVSIFGPDKLSRSTTVMYESFSPSYVVSYDKKKDTANFVTKTRTGKPAKIPAVAKKLGLHKPTPIAEFNKALQTIAKDVKIAKQEKEANIKSATPEYNDGLYLGRKGAKTDGFFLLRLEDNNVAFCLAMDGRSLTGKAKVPYFKFKDKARITDLKPATKAQVLDFMDTWQTK